MRYPQVIVLPFFGIIMIIVGIWLLLRAADVGTDDLVRVGFETYYTSGWAQLKGVGIIILGVIFIIMGILL